MRHVTNRPGFALPMAILLIGFLTAGVVAAFSRIEAEARTVDDSAEEMKAFAIAQAGLERAIAAGDTGTTAPPNTVSYTFDDGTAVVTRFRVRAATTNTDTAVWLFRSVGTSSVSSGNRPAASRTVAQLLFRSGGTMQVLSSWTSLSGLTKNGASGDISGADECGEQGELAGVAVPDGGFSGHQDAIDGDPPIEELGTQEEMADGIAIDWVGITDPAAPAITPDIVVCKSGTYGYISSWGPCGSWPTSALSNDNYWPVIVINGSSALPSDGQGTLIVTGDLTFGGGDTWDGIILVGGKITDNGSGNISGAVVSGLNVLKGMTVGQSSKANGTKDYSYNSCEVAKAANSFSKVTPIQNAWMDNWPAW